MFVALLLVCADLPITVGDISGRGFKSHTTLQTPTNGTHNQNRQNEEAQFLNWVIPKRLRDLTLYMANEATKTATTVRTRLSADEKRRLKDYADRMGLPGLSTALRSLAFENLALKEAQHANEAMRRKAADDAVRRQLGGS